MMLFSWLLPIAADDAVVVCRCVGKWCCLFFSLLCRLFVVAVAVCLGGVITAFCLLLLLLLFVVVFVVVG